MIVDNPAQVQYFQRDGFLIFLAPDKSYVIRNIYQIQFINRLVKRLKLLSLNTWNLIMFRSWWLNIWPAIRGAAWQRFAVTCSIALSQGLQCCLLVLATDRQSIISEGSNWMCKLRSFVICVGKTTDQCQTHPPVRHLSYIFCSTVEVPAVHSSFIWKSKYRSQLSTYPYLVLWWEAENNF